MADSASESYVHCDTFSIRQISSSLFGIPGFLVGLSSKVSSDVDSVRSPTSPLDFRVFVNLSNPFSVKSPRSSSQNGYHKKWDCSKVGLGIVNSLAEENKSSSDVLYSLKRKNIVFGPQVKTNIPTSSRCCHESVNSLTKSNSLPPNYMISTLSQTKNPKFPFGRSNGVLENGELLLESEPFSSSLISPAQNHNLSSKSFSTTAGTMTMSAPVVMDRGLPVDRALSLKSYSLPIPIGPSGHAGSLATNEIELSEDYTCIISHGPNPKTTHIFGDCILECPTHEFANSDKEGEEGVELPQVAVPPEGLSLTHYPSDEFLSFCYSCKKKLDNGEDIYMYRGEKAFCSFDCRSEEIFAEEEIEKAYESSKSSPESSYHEDFFVLCMPVT
ncbi:Pre-mRNA cleavage complex 2 protein Pcf11, putative isoform 2 [Melia azedarach]|uniref:Pre-mRNA cleavage complex 2 protein Pcf11, putative isoform 2 n=1 Tax=Melia azedarach TaxID=155640 RepID=A0ACC1Y365_MELAZ|nr:Pre-mRNA cleavage complex 2 protein Pcf11, putative isoform 2 [Melia azedarach]